MNIMFNKIFLLVLSLLCFEVSQIHAQASSSCTTPDQASGTCITINECPSLFNLLMNQNANNTVRTFLRDSVCEYVRGGNPIVCCPLPNIKNLEKIKLPKVPDCGLSNFSNPRVVNGVPARLGEFPWMVALGYRNEKNPQLPKWLCGGSLITDRHVLTAAHCIYNRPDLYLARLGDLDLFSDDDGARPSNIAISKTKIHNNFSPSTFSNDIAILTLKEAVNNPTVWPICLPLIEPYRSMTYLNFQPTLAGWGSVSFNGPSSSSLQQIFVPVLSNQQCSRVFAKVATIDDKIICAGSLNGDKDACGGDSGGPLMHIIKEGNHYRVYQIGIVSYGFRCAQPGYPGVYTRVTSFLDWIQDNLD